MLIFMDDNAYTPVLLYLYFTSRLAILNTYLVITINSGHHLQKTKSTATEPGGLTWLPQHTSGHDPGPLIYNSDCRNSSP
jgi:hypothetical protein